MRDGANDNYLTSLAKLYAGRVDRAVPAIIGAWALGLVLNYLSGSVLSIRVIAMSLVGTLLAVGFAIWIKRKYQVNS